MKYILLLITFVNMGLFGQKNSEFVIPKEKKTSEKDLNLKQIKEEIVSACAEFLKNKNNVDSSAVCIEKKLLELIEKGLNDNFKGSGNLALKNLLSEIEDINNSYKKLGSELSRKLKSLDQAICEISKK